MEHIYALNNTDLGIPSASTSGFPDTTQSFAAGRLLGQPHRRMSLGPSMSLASPGGTVASGRPRPPLPKRTMTDNLDVGSIDPMIWSDPPGIRPKIPLPHRAATLDAVIDPHMRIESPIFSDSRASVPITPSVTSTFSASIARQNTWTPPARANDWREHTCARQRLTDSFVDTQAEAAAAALKQNAEATVAAAIGDDGDDVALTSSPTAMATLPDVPYVPPLEQERSPSPPDELARRMRATTLTSSPISVGDVSMPSRQNAAERDLYSWAGAHHALSPSVRPAEASRPMYTQFGVIPDVFSAAYASPSMPGTVPGLVPEMFMHPVDPAAWPHPHAHPHTNAHPHLHPQAQPQPHHTPSRKDVRDGRWRDRAYRMPLRDDVRAAAIDSHGRFDMSDFRGSLVQLSTDQHGSRLIQEKLDHCNADERGIIFAELYPESLRLMSDVFGNYVIQKLIEHGTPAQVYALCEKLQGHVLNLSLGTYGCRVVQKAFEHMSQEQKVVLGRELKPYVLHCVRDQNANHVIQKILEQLPASELDFISSAFEGHVGILASHCYSCRVLQRIFAYCTEPQYRSLLNEMHRDALRLMQDQYGNYVVQWVLQNGMPRDRAELINKTKTRVLRLARHKFASNVMEQVLEVSSPVDRRELLDELLAPLDPAQLAAEPPIPVTSTTITPAMLMMQDQYANYVLQRFLQVTTGDDRARLVEAIRPVLTALRSLAAPGAGTSAFGYGIRLPGGGHIGAKPLMAIERLIEHPPERNSAQRNVQSRSRAAVH